MALVRLVTTLARLDEVATHANETPIVLEVRDADTVIAAASLKDRLSAPVGVWLALSDGYLAQLVARDVATLSWLIELDVVVVSGPRAVEGAEVVRALLSDDEVNFTNDVATIRGAYNRPAPPRHRLELGRRGAAYGWARVARRVARDGRTRRVHDVRLVTQVVGRCGRAGSSL